jgi:hypothetical protein
MRSGLVLLPALPLILLVPADSVQAQNYPWCASYATDGVVNCGFVGIEQCQAALGGNGGYCVANRAYRPTAESPDAPQIRTPKPKSAVAAKKSTVAAKTKPAIAAQTKATIATETKPTIAAKTKTTIAAKKPTAAANAQKPPSARLTKRTSPLEKSAKYTVAGKTTPVPSARPNDKADPVTEKAKASIAAMMEKPASAAFGQMTRATKDLRGESLDTICGYVKGKNASGRDTGEMPFLYIVHDNEAYLVDGNNLTAETVYRVLCK